MFLSFKQLLEILLTLSFEFLLLCSKAGPTTPDKWQVWLGCTFHTLQSHAVGQMWPFGRPDLGPSPYVWHPYSTQMFSTDRETSAPLWLVATVVLYQPSSWWKHRPQGNTQRNQTAYHQTTQPIKKSRNLIPHQWTHTHTDTWRQGLCASISMKTNFTIPIVFICDIFQHVFLFQVYFSYILH